MNFTRDPIVETIITSKEGYKLTLKNSKGNGEEFIVDAVEVVTFGKSFFFRSLERPKSFLLPVGDYEIVETKETRVVLKNAPLDRSVKIGGGKAPKAPKEDDSASSEEGTKKRKSSRRTRKAQEPRPEIKPPPIMPGKKGEEEVKAEGEPLPKEEPKKTDKLKTPPSQEGQEVSSAMFKSLFPPPPGLVSTQPSVASEGSCATDESGGQRAPAKPRKPSSRKRKETSKDDDLPPPPRNDEGPRYHSASPVSNSANEEAKETKEEPAKKPSEAESSKDENQDNEAKSFPINPEGNLAF